MINFADAQYIAYMSLGSQTIGAVLDTGSFELIVFSKLCYSCGQAAKYDSKQSATYSKGHFESQQSYGSGDAFSNDASDTVSIGPLGNHNQSFWEVLDADMPVLLDAQFHAIVGVGPPETPAADAWANALTAVKDIAAKYDGGYEVPSMADMDFAVNKVDVAYATSHRSTVLTNFGVSTFSICIGAKPGSDGFFVWNDTAAALHPELFVRVPIVGKHTWTANLTGVWLSPRTMTESVESVGCGSGCGAMIDSGTTLLVIPNFAVNRLLEAVKRLDSTCSNIQDLPDLVFELGGKRFALPPDAYVAEVAGQVPAHLASFARVRRLRNPQRTCELVVLESSATTSLGPLWILGVPFLRSYYTTFDTGRSLSDRALHVAAASDECWPVHNESERALGYKSVANLAPMGRRVAKPFWRRLDPKKILVPHAALRATQTEYMPL